MDLKPFMRQARYAASQCMKGERSGVRLISSEEKGNSEESYSALVLLKLFINGIERCHTIDASYRISVALFLHVNNIQCMITEDLEKLFNCFDAMGRNVNKQNSNLRATHFQQIHFFCNIFTCME